MGNPYIEKLDAMQYQKALTLRQPLVFIFSDNDNITNQFKEYVLGKLNASANGTDGISYAVVGSEQEEVAKFVHQKTKKDDVLAVCQLVRDTDECVVVPYDLNKSLEDQISRIMRRLTTKAKAKNAVGKVVDQGRRIMRALDNTTLMNTIDNWKITEILGKYYEDHGIGTLICLACAIGVFLAVVILIAMECV